MRPYTLQLPGYIEQMAAGDNPIEVLEAFAQAFHVARLEVTAKGKKPLSIGPFDVPFETQEIVKEVGSATIVIEVRSNTAQDYIAAVASLAAAAVGFMTDAPKPRRKKEPESLDVPEVEAL